MPSEPAYTRWSADEEDQVQFAGSEKPQRCLTGRKGFLIKLLSVCVLAVVSLLVGYVIRRNVHEQMCSPAVTGPTTSPDKPVDFNEVMASELSRALGSRAEFMNIQLRKYDSSRVCGTDDVSKAVIDLYKDWREQLDASRRYKYKAFTSLPIADSEESNRGYLLNGAGDVVESSNNNSFIFCPYSDNGQAKGQVTFASYGLESEFNELNSLGVKVSGSIVIMRYGKIPAGVKVRRASNAGAVGVILYQEAEKVDTWTDAQSDAAVRLEHVRADTGVGDIMSPYTPSVGDDLYSHQVNPASVDATAKIPVMPVSWAMAHMLLSGMSGPEAPDVWQRPGTLKYRLGPGYSEKRANWSVQMGVNLHTSLNDVINVIGTITGQVERDRYVIVGCHVDTLANDVSDSGSGLAVMTALIDILADVVKNKDWRPRRTILFAAWDGHAMGMLGSYEWVQQYYEELFDRAVAYIDLSDLLVGGDELSLEASPLLQQLVKNVTDDVQSASGIIAPKYKTIRTLPWRGSDIESFLYLAGIPSVRFGYRKKLQRDDYHSSQYFAAYHTQLDNLEYLTNIMEKRNEHLPHLLTISRIAMRLLLLLSDSVRLPVDVTEYSKVMQDGYNKLKRELKETWKNLKTSKYESVDLDNAEKYFENKLSKFKDAANVFSVLLQNNPSKNELELRQLNDEMMKLSRVFIDQTHRFSQSPTYRNMLLSPNKHDRSEFRVFPDLTDALLSAQTHTDLQAAKAVRRALELNALMINSAANLIGDGLLRNVQ